MVSSSIKHFETYLSQKGLRLTGQREIIAQAFFKSKGHISTEELYRKVQKTSPRIGFVTVYRTLKLLTEAGLASGKHFNGNFTRFESKQKTDHHDHLVCTQCGKIIEFKNDRIEDLQATIAKLYGFILTDHTLDIYGICPDCQANAS